MMQGYVTILQSDGRRIGEHRIVAEAKIGRKLLPGEVVHHINGMKLDNRPENLEVMTVSEHVSHHRRTNRGE